MSVNILRLRSRQDAHRSPGPTDRLPEELAAAKPTILSRPTRLVVALLAALTVLAATGISTGAVASAARVATPGWVIHAVAQPTNFPAAGGSGEYTFTATNVGGSQTSGQITVKVTFPPHVVTAATPEAPGWSCTPEGEGHGEVTCTTGTEVGPAAQPPPIAAPVTILPGASGTLISHAEVYGGGAALCGGLNRPCPSASIPTAIGAPPPEFRVLDFNSYIAATYGTSDAQAGDHPSSFTVDLTLPDRGKIGFFGEQSPVEWVKDIAIDLPLGFVGNAQATPKCTITELVSLQLCPSTTRIGTFSLLWGNNLPLQGNSIYNVVPERGHPAEFGMYIPGLQKSILLYASVVPTSSGYVVRVTAPDLPDTVQTRGFSATFFGDPVAQNASPGTPTALFSNPSNCSPAAEFQTRVYADSWGRPGRTNSDGTIDTSDPNWKTAASPAPVMEGCGLLQFNPTISLTPETQQARSPSGYALDLTVPQTPDIAPNLATPSVRKIQVTLPEGVAISPSAANGLQACPDSQFEPASADAASCPAASQIATVSATTPVLEAPLEGQIFLGVPGCAPCSNADARNGNLVRLFMQLQGSGVVIKLPGMVSVDPTTGRLTATFDNLVQQPVSEVKVQIKGGSRAPLTTPQDCGAATATSSIVPWGTPYLASATPTTSFSIDQGCASRGFAPSFTAGSIGSQAGAYSPLTTTFSRSDQDQNLNRLQVQLPAGLIGMLSSVPLCGDAQASAGACSAASAVGHVTVGAGAGSSPIYLPVAGEPPNPVYLTGPYRGAPFGLAFVVPAIAGPFNLGTVVVRAAINVDPSTARVTITSDPLPQMLAGIPLQVRTVNVTIDRPGFTFNPTSCEPMQIAGTLTSLGGLSAPVSSRFQAANCANLPFKPSFAVSTSGKTSKANGASLHVHLSMNEGPSSNPQVPAEANIAKVDVQLPVVLPSRLTTLQKACTAAQFDSNPAGCPEASFVGTATAHTPILSNPLSGPAILVSHGGAAFPDLVLVLQGEGIRIDLVGNTDIKKGLTYSRFEAVPDAPVTSFDLTLPEGPHSVLAATRNLCALTKTTTTAKHGTRRQNGRTVHVLQHIKHTVATPLLMPTTITGQNGAVIKQTTKIAVLGCPKAKKAKKAKRARKAAHRGGKRRK
jgi:hypothetical protein